MTCEYGFYNKDEDYYPKLYCKIDNKMCPYVKKCEKLERFLPLEEQERCYKRMEQKMKKIPKGSCYICFERKGYLYINLNEDETIKVKNTLGNINQDYVYVRDSLDGYELSLKPFEEKRNYRKTTNEKPKK